MIKAVFFDLDGTLFDTSAVIIQGFNYLFDKYKDGYRMDKSEYVNVLGPALKDSFPMYFKESFDELLAGYRFATDKCLTKAYVPLCKGVKETIPELHKMGIKIAAVTSRQHKSAETALDIYGFSKYFDFVIGCNDVNEVKPNPESFIKTLEALNIKSNEAIMIGDHYNDIKGGVNANVDSYAVGWTISNLEELKKAGAKGIINDMREIIDIIKENR